MVVFLRRKSVLLTPFSHAGCSKRPAFSPAQPWRLFHPPALSLPRQPLRPGTRLVPSKAAAPRLTHVSRLTFHGSWERRENDAGGLFQHLARRIRMVGHSPAQRFLVIGSILAGCSVAAGAFGAHALKEILDAPMLQVFETATRYVMYHAFGLCIVSWAIDRYPGQGLEKSGWLFILGILLFSGSLYVVSLSGIRWMGAVTPIGGLAFLAGWILLGWGVWRDVLPRTTSRNRGDA